MIPRYRQKVRWVPGHLANPVWVDDSDFDITFHVRRSALPRPGSDEQLRELVSRLMSRRLDRNRPLWEMYLVEGLGGGRIAIISKTHHAMVDGISAIDIGQVEGAFIQGMGWLTTEELWWNPAGKLMTHAPSTYKIPAVSDCPEDFRVRLFDNANVEDSIHRSKAVGEPPLMHAFSVREALREAVGAFGPAGHSVDLAAPSTPEAVFWAIEAARAAALAAAAPTAYAEV